MLYNMMTCIGGPAWRTGLMGGCSISWLILGFIFILGMVIRRQTDDGIMSGVNYSVIGALVLGLGAAITLITIFGAPKWGFLGGIVGLALGGFVAPFFGLGGGGSE